MPYDPLEVYPWAPEDEGSYQQGSHRWKHYRPGTKREAWNADPMWRSGKDGQLEPQCSLCGYRDYRFNMVYTGTEGEALRWQNTNDHGAPTCFPCWTFTHRRPEFEAYWAKWDAEHSAQPIKGAQVTSGIGLKKFTP